MRYTLTFLEENYEALQAHFSSTPGVEGAAYLLCRPSRHPDEYRLLVREVIPVAAEDIASASAMHMQIPSRSFLSAMKRAAETKSAFVFVHSHPDAYPNHSPQDDQEETKLFRTAHIRVEGIEAHASLIFTSAGLSAARAWLEDGSVVPVERVRIIGKRFRFWFPNDGAEPIPEFFDRQVRAFGEDLQRHLGRLRVGVIGCGGTGSAVIEQLTRLGIGNLLVVDPQTFDTSNVNRVYGSRAIDQGIPKVKIAERLIADVGVGTQVTTIQDSITYKPVFSELRQCDVVFGCTDDEWGRSLLTRLAIYYAIPVIDMGVKIDSNDGEIRSIQGRVSTLLPSASCLFCRERISSDRIGAQVMRETDPDRAAELTAEGYIPELDTPAPAVVPFTTTLAATAVSEFLHRLTGFMGEDRDSVELLHRFDESDIRRIARPIRDNCFCSRDAGKWCKGDVRPMLDTNWRTV